MLIWISVPPLKRLFRVLTIDRLFAVRTHAHLCRPQMEVDNPLRTSGKISGFDFDLGYLGASVWVLI